MDGSSVKKLLIANDVNLNEYKYFENTTKYGIDEIPNIYVDKKLLKKKLLDNVFGIYDREYVEYVMRCIYHTHDDKVDPSKILNFFDIGK